MALTEIVGKFVKEVPRGTLKDTKVVYDGLCAEYHISVWERQTGIPISSNRMLSEVAGNDPIWQLIERSDEIGEEDEEGNILYATKLGLLGVVGYALRHPITFFQDMKGVANRALQNT